MNRIRVVHVISGLGLAGAETMLFNLLSGWNRDRFCGEVISLTGEGPNGERIRRLGIPVRALGLRRGGAAPNPIGLLRLAAWLRAARPDVVQTWMYHADVVGGAASRLATGAPVLWNLRHSDFDPEGRDRALRRVVRLGARLSRWVPARIVCCGETVRDVHATLGYPRARMVVIPNGFDLDRHRPSDAHRAAVRRELDIDADALLVGLVARFHPQKDLRSFVDAAALVTRNRPNVRFVLCGYGMTPENESLAAWIRAAGLENRIRLLGRRDDVFRLHAALDIACSASAFGEGFPNVIGEAMAAGVPCVATDVGDARRLVGATGRIVAPSDPRALAAACADILDLPPERRRRLGAAARRRIARRFSLPATVRRYEALYEEVADAQAPGSLPAPEATTDPDRRASISLS